MASGRGQRRALGSGRTKARIKSRHYSRLRERQEAIANAKPNIPIVEHYTHAAHCGNTADCVKHTVLAATLLRLCQRDVPLMYIETHAGRGWYNLGDESTRAVFRLFTGEFETTRGLNDYVQLVKRCNPAAGDRLAFYPGSPLIASQLLGGDGHTLCLCEWAQAEAEALAATMKGDKRAEVVSGDGYTTLMSRICAGRDGLVLIDPPYVGPGEMEDAINAVSRLCREWPTVTSLLWYPILTSRTSDKFADAGCALVVEGASVIQLDMCDPSTGTWLKPDRFFMAPIDLDSTASRLQGCGMLLINPPAAASFVEELVEVGGKLAEALGLTDDGGMARVRQLEANKPT